LVRKVPTPPSTNDDPIGDIAQRIRSLLDIVRQPRIGGSSDIAGGEIGEQRILLRPAVTVTDVALRLAAEQVVARTVPVD
jgi:hypothetical protein